MTGKENRLAVLDFLRAIAAVLVLLFHLWHFWYTNGASTFSFLMPKTQISGMEEVNLFPLFDRMHLNLGALGVSIFFLLTGFLAGKSLRRQKPGKYLPNKILRLYPIYFLGFLITFIHMYLYIRLDGREFPYTVKDFLIQVSLLREWFWVPSIDGLSWTLEAQLKFHLVMTLLALFGKQRSARAIVTISVVLAIGAMLFSVNMDRMWENQLTFLWRFGSGFRLAAVCLTFMMLGIPFYMSYEGAWSRSKTIFTGLCLYSCFVFSVLAYSADPITDLTSYTFGLAIFGVCCLLLRDGEKMFFSSGVISTLSKVSYPLYVLHGLNGFMLMTRLYEAGWNAYLCFIIAVSVTFFLSCLMHRYVEKPLSGWIGRLLFSDAPRLP